MDNLESKMRELYKEATKQTPETLGDFVKHAMCDYPHDYGSVCGIAGIIWIWRELSHERSFGRRLYKRWISQSQRHRKAEKLHGVLVLGLAWTGNARRQNKGDDSLRCKAQVQGQRQT